MPQTERQHRWHSKLHLVWTAMKSRCLNPNVPSFPRYGGRGIGVCREWHSYAAFRGWALTNGYASGLTIERIDNDGDYEPGNCRWATWREQGRNRRNNHLLTYGGKQKTIVEWSEALGMSPVTLKNRIAHGWPVAEALTSPVKSKGRKVTEAQVSEGKALLMAGLTQTDVAAALGVSQATVSRLRREEVIVA